MIDVTGNLSACEEILCKNIAEHLHAKYPGHLWMVGSNQGIVEIRNLALSGRWGFVVHKDKIDPDYRLITRAGGELLERFRVSRGRMRLTEMDSLERNISGQAVFDE